MRLAPLIAEGDHDVDTVKAEGLSGKHDDLIYATCRAKGRVLMVLDMDFSNPLRFDPSATEGIIVLRIPRPTLPIVRATILQIAPLIRPDQVRGKLWIVEPTRIRVYDLTKVD